MLDLLGDGNFWAGLSGTLAAAAWGIPRGIKFAKDIFGSHNKKRSLEARVIELQRQLRDKNFELELTQTAYRRLEDAYDRQFQNQERFVSMEDELTSIKERINSKR